MVTRPHPLATKRPTGFASVGRVNLPQCLDAGAEVDVIRLAIQHQCGDGFDSGFLGFAHALFVLTEVNNFHFETRGVERGGDVLFGGDTHGAARVVEYGFGFHSFSSFVFWLVIEPDHFCAAENYRQRAQLGGVVTEKFPHDF